MLEKIKNKKMFMALLSAVFVFLYGSGFVGAKLGILNAGPLAYLVWRFLASAVLFLILALVFKASWPKTSKEIFHIAIAGSLMMAVFSVGMVEAMHLGVPASITALIVALQPLCVALISACLMKKKIYFKQWCGLGVGLLGVVFVIGAHTNLNTDYVLGLMFSGLALLGLTAGNLYQKHFCSRMNILSGGTIQSFAATLVSVILATIFHDWLVNWNAAFIFSIFWVSVIVSLGAISILYFLLRQREAHHVASLFYAVPVSTALVAYVVFGATLDYLQILGMLITVVGVCLANSR